MSTNAVAEAAAQIYRDLQAGRPATARELGLMQGFPAAADKLVTWANWIAAPFNRWGLQHLADLRPSLTVHAGTTPVATLPVAPMNLEAFRFESISGTEQSLGAHLAAGYTDAFIRSYLPTRSAASPPAATRPSSRRIRNLPPGRQVPPIAASGMYSMTRARR